MVLFEVKQHKYKLVLGWVTVPWVVLLIDRSRISQEPNAGTLLCYDHDLSLIPGIWWYRILDGHPWWIYLQENNIFEGGSLQNLATLCKYFPKFQFKFNLEQQNFLRFLKFRNFEIFKVSRLCDTITETWYFKLFSYI